MNKTTISIIIPTLNENDHLPLLLSDLVRQNDPDFNVIIVDGNSDDNTREAALKYQDKLKLKLLTVNCRNVSYQRNYGVGHTNAEYIIFIDADIRIKNNFVNKVKKNIEKSRNLIYLFSLLPDRNLMSQAVIFKLFNYLVRISQFTNKPFSTGGAMVVNRFYFQLLGGFNEKLYLAEDHDIILRAKKGGVFCYVLPDVGIIFSMRRFRYEGRMKVIFKYALGTWHYWQKGKIDNKIFDYNMGGTQYKLPKKDKTELAKNINTYFKKARQYFKKLSTTSSL